MNEREIFLLIVATLPLAILLLSTWFDRGMSLLSPFWGMMFPVFVGTTLKATMMVFGTDSAPATSGLFPTTDLAWSALAVAIFLLMTATSYFLIRRRSHQAINIHANFPIRVEGTVAVVSSILVILLAGIGVFLLFQATGGVESVSDLSRKRFVRDGDSVGSGGEYRILTSFVRVNTVILLAYWLRAAQVAKPRLLSFAILLGTIATLAIAVLLSQRTDLALLMLALLGCLKITKTVSTKTLAVSIVALLVFSNLVLVLRYASYQSSGELSLSNLATQSLQIPQRLVENEDGPDIVKISRIRNYIDSGGKLLYGQKILLSPALLVPRRVWPNKPTDLAMGPYVTTVVYNEIPFVTLGPAPPSLVGEAYLNAGWFGIALVGLLYGGTLGLVVNRLLARPNASVWATAFALLILPRATYMVINVDIIQAIILMAPDVLVAVIILGFHRLVGAQRLMQT